jgi:hypothetical protein
MNEAENNVHSMDHQNENLNVFFIVFANDKTGRIIVV